MFRRLIARLDALALAIVLSPLLPACSMSWLDQKPKVIGAKIAAIPQGVAAAISAAPAPAPITAMRQYRVAPGDDLEVILKGTDTVLGVATVSSDGKATLPRRGEQKISGLTLGDVEQIIEGKNDAGVKVRLRAPAPVYVVGAVGMAGAVPYQDGMTLMALLTQAGGATHKADLRKVFVTPKSESEQSVDFDPALPILPGDVVRLKERYF